MIRKKKKNRTFQISATFGLDAGSAMEGAVGSRYNIDATYLGPRVNIASRLYGACKQFGVNNICSENFQKLLSNKAKEKFRHIDTCTVKGSVKIQRLFTYDARHMGVDFFSLYRCPKVEYNQDIWDNDKDLKAMRKHITPEFEARFNEGRNLYLSCKWNEATRVLREANELMIRWSDDSGAMTKEIEAINRCFSDKSKWNEEIKALRIECGDGPSKRLIDYMASKNGKPPLNFRKGAIPHRILETK